MKENTLNSIFIRLKKGELTKDQARLLAYTAIDEVLMNIAYKASGIEDTSEHKKLRKELGNMVDEVLKAI